MQIDMLAGNRQTNRHTKEQTKIHKDDVHTERQTYRYIYIFIYLFFPARTDYINLYPNNDLNHTCAPENISGHFGLLFLRAPYKFQFYLLTYLLIYIYWLYDKQWLRYKEFGVGTPIRERLATQIRGVGTRMCQQFEVWEWRSQPLSLTLNTVY